MSIECVEAPNDLNETQAEKLKIFLAGSIEMGTAENWQEKIANDLVDFSNVVLLNPRRKDWDSSWEQSIDNPQFKEQVAWELEMLEDSDLVVFYFDPNTKSPITLLELGLWANTDKAVAVCCPDGFWRKGNVDIVCSLYDVPCVDNYDDFIKALKLCLRIIAYRP